MAEGLVLALEELVVVQLICVITIRLYSVELLLQEVVVGLDLMVQGGTGVVVDREMVAILPIVIRMVLLVHLVVCLVVVVVVIVVPPLAIEDLVEMGVYQHQAGAPGAVAADTLVAVAEKAVVTKEGVVVGPVTVVVLCVSQLYMGRQRAATTDSRIYILHLSQPRSPADSPVDSPVDILICAPVNSLACNHFQSQQINQHPNRGGTLQVNRQWSPVVSHLCSPLSNHLCSLPVNHLYSLTVSHPHNPQSNLLLSRLSSRLISLC